MITRRIRCNARGTGTRIETESILGFLLFGDSRRWVSRAVAKRSSKLLPVPTISLPVPDICPSRFSVWVDDSLVIVPCSCMYWSVLLYRIDIVLLSWVVPCDP